MKANRLCLRISMNEASSNMCCDSLAFEKRHSSGSLHGLLMEKSYFISDLNVLEL
jgi:hypothetical protein